MHRFHRGILKPLQITLYSLSRSKLFILLIIILVFLTINSILHVVDTILDWHMTNSATFFNKDKNSQFLMQYRDNLLKKDLKDRLCYEPMDIVYTWVNGSDAYHQFVKEFFSEAYSIENQYKRFEELNIPSTHTFWKWYHAIGAENLERLPPSIWLQIWSLGIRSKWQFEEFLDPSKMEAVEIGLNHQSESSSDANAQLASSISAPFVSLSKVLQRQRLKHILLATSRDDSGKLILNGNASFLHNSTLDIDNSNNRFRDNDELRYSMRSLEKFAPWVRRIYLVTSGQVPTWLDISNPRVQVIPHSDLFVNTSHLPVFSSPAIESQLHRIPGLSSKFIYLNDDVFFGNDVLPEDFYSKSTGQNVFLTWDIPECSPGCNPNWIADGYCDMSCNTTACEYDGGDCIGNNVRTSSSYGSSSSSSYFSGTTSSWFQNYQSNVDKQCNSRCPNSWVGDRFCDKACNVPECGYDGGDCGTTDMITNLLHFNLTRDTKIFEVPFGTNALYINLTRIFPIDNGDSTSKSKLTSGTHDNPDVIRTSTLSQTHRLLTLTLFPNVTGQPTNITLTGETQGHEEKIQFQIQVLKLATGLNERSKSDKIVESQQSQAREGNNILDQSTNSIPSESIKNAHQEVSLDRATSSRPLKVSETIFTKNLDQSQQSKELEPPSTIEAARIFPANDINESKIFSNEKLKQKEAGTKEKQEEQKKELKQVRIEESKEERNQEGKDSKNNASIKNVESNMGAKLSSIDSEVIQAPSMDDEDEDDTVEEVDDDYEYDQDFNPHVNRHLMSIPIKNHDNINYSSREEYISQLANLEQQQMLTTVQNRMETYRAEESESIQFEHAPGRRKLMDKFGDSLIHVDRLLNKKFGRLSRKVPAHMPHMIDKQVMERVYQTWSKEFNTTSSNRFRSSNDMQYTFSYFYFLMQEGIEYNPEQYFTKELDRNSDGKLDSYELRHLARIFEKHKITIESLKNLKEEILNRTQIVESAQTTQDSTISNDAPTSTETLSSTESTSSVPLQSDSSTADSTPTPTLTSTSNSVLSQNTWWQNSITADVFPEYLTYISDIANLTCEEMKIQTINLEVFIDSGLSKLLGEKLNNTVNRNKFQLRGVDDVGFHMIDDNEESVLSILDGLRIRNPKFICLNDDMNKTSPNAAILNSLHQFFEWYFPNPSQFELPKGKSNPSHLHIHELRRYYQKQRYMRIFMWTIEFVAIGIAIVFLLHRTNLLRLWNIRRPILITHHEHVKQK